MDGAPKYLVAQLDEIEGTPCPCGVSKRAFLVPENEVASIHLVEISQDAPAHYHKRMTEIYYVLEGEGELELDGGRESIRPGSVVLIPPGTRHRAVGTLKILNVAIPAFDEKDEWFD